VIAFHKLGTVEWFLSVFYLFVWRLAFMIVFLCLLIINVEILPNSSFVTTIIRQFFLYYAYAMTSHIRRNKKI